MDEKFPAGSAWMGGAFINLSEAKISVLDWGFLRSDATYDVVHVWNNRFFRLDSHIDRFYFRGDKEVMQKIEDCFNVANSNTAYLKKTNQVPFGDVNTTLKAVPREEANLEAEVGETVLTDMNNDGDFELYEIPK